MELEPVKPGIALKQTSEDKGNIFLFQPLIPVLQIHPNPHPIYHLPKMLSVLFKNSNRFKPVHFLVTLGMTISLGLGIMETGTAQEYLIQFESLNSQDGLSDNRINDIVLDEFGVMWMGSNVGINRYDGQKVETFLLEQGTQVNQLMITSTGEIWAATTQGLHYFDPNKQFSKLQNTLHSEEITSIIEFNDSTLLFSDLTGKLYRLSLLHRTLETLPLDFLGGYITQQIKDPAGNLWVSTSVGDVFRISLPTNQLKKIFSLPTRLLIHDLEIDQEGKIWVASDGNGLFQLDSTGKQRAHFLKSDVPNTINNNLVLSLQAKGNNLWIGTDGGGLNLYQQDKQSFHHFLQSSKENSISDNSILKIQEGGNGTVFLATVHGGVSIFKDHLFLQNFSPEEIGFPTVDQQGSVLLEDSSGQIWMSAGREGLLRFNRKTGDYSLYKDDKGNPNDLNGMIVLSLYEDPQQRLWIGTFRGGLSILNLRTNQFEKLHLEHNFNSVFSITADYLGNIWVGHRKGVAIFDQQLNIREKLSPASDTDPLLNGVNAIFRDLNKDMWVGTIHGLYRYEMNDTGLKKHRYLNETNSGKTISGNRITSIQQAPDLSILVGTYGNGLNRYNRKTDSFERIYPESPQLNFVEGILVDKQNKIWLSTYSGLSQIDLDETIINYDKKDGIHPFTGGEASLDRSGNILMAGNFGLSYFDPQQLEFPALSGKINLTSATISNENSIRNISSTELITFQNRPDKALEVDQDNIIFSIGFAYNDPFLLDQTSYAYRLLGIKDTWNPIGNQKSISFPNLKPGEYTLEIRPMNKYGEWLPNSTFLKINIAYKIWEKTWFQTFLIALVLILLWKAYKLRIAQIKKQKANLVLLLNEKAEEVKIQESKIAKSKIELLEIEKLNQKLLQKQLSDELKFKTEELTNYTLRSVHKNDLLKEIKESLQVEIKQKPINKTNLKKIIDQINDSFIFDKEWDQFYSLLHDIHPSFIDNLKSLSIKLSDRDIKLSALILMGFNSQNIATLFGISLSSVKVSRHRLRKKLLLEDHENLQEYLESLAS